MTTISQTKFVFEANIALEAVLPWVEKVNLGQRPELVGRTLKYGEFYAESGEPGVWGLIEEVPGGIRLTMNPGYAYPYPAVHFGLAVGGTPLSQLEVCEDEEDFSHLKRFLAGNARLADNYLQVEQMRAFLAQLDYSLEDRDGIPADPQGMFQVWRSWQHNNNAFAFAKTLPEMPQLGWGETLWLDDEKSKIAIGLGSRVAYGYVFTTYIEEDEDTPNRRGWLNHALFVTEIRPSLGEEIEQNSISDSCMVQICDVMSSQIGNDGSESWSVHKGTATILKAMKRACKQN